MVGRSVGSASLPDDGLLMFYVLCLSSVGVLIDAEYSLVYDGFSKVFVVDG